GHVHDEHCGHDHHGHDHHHHDHDDHHHHGEGGHNHGDDVKGVALTLDKPIDGRKITQWLDALLQRQGPDILRAKGIIDVAGEPKRLVFQAVHMILEGDLQREWREGEKRYSRMVFIGRDLDEAALRTGFEACAA
ncbi:MAG: GTP-binding protein, partial [Alphaproteobacteria bacterium]